MWQNNTSVHEFSVKKLTFPSCHVIVDSLLWTALCWDCFVNDCLLIFNCLLPSLPSVFSPVHLCPVSPLLVSIPVCVCVCLHLLNHLHLSLVPISHHTAAADPLITSHRINTWISSPVFATLLYSLSWIMSALTERTRSPQSARKNRNSDMCISMTTGQTTPAEDDDMKWLKAPEHRPRWCHQGYLGLGLKDVHWSSSVPESLYSL